MLRIPCEFVEEKYYYTCKVSLQIIPEDKNIASFLGEHTQHNKSDEYVNEVKFVDSTIPRIPYALEKHFKNIRRLVMNNCKLKDISKFDLRGLTDLFDLDVSNNNLKVLPGDLFFYTKDLKRVSFANNKLEKVNGSLFDCCENVYYIDFQGNFNFDFPSNIINNVEDYKKNFKEACVKLEKACQEHNEACGGLEKPKKAGKSVSDYLTAAIKEEKYKDFTIEVENKEFKVHKIVFAARSKLFDELMTKNPESDKLQLQDISAEIFEQILDFIYTDKPPNDDSDFLKIVVAASKLKIKELELFAAQKMIEKLQSEYENVCVS